MKTNLGRFAPLGLVLSLLAVLVFVIGLIVKGLASGGMITLPDPKALDQWLWICVGVFVLGLALTAFLDPNKTRNFLLGRQVQYGSNAIIMLVAFLGILFFINLLVYQYSSTSTPWDWTEDQQNTLAPETLNLLKALPAPVTVRAYYTSQTPKDTIQKLLDSFKQNSKGQLTYQFIDPNYDPTGAANDGVTRDATIVIVMGERKETVNSATEQDLDSTIIKLTNPTQYTIYFLTGHAERDTQNPGDTSLLQIKANLQKKNYIVKVLNLSNQRSVPEDAKAVIVPGPQVPLAKDEAVLLETYVNKGGALIIMEDPRAVTKFGSAPDPLADVLAKWGVTLEDDLVVDSNMNNPLFAVVDTQSYTQYPHPITAKLTGYNLAFYTTRSIKLADKVPEGVVITPIAQTYPTSVWGETDTSSKSVSYDPAKDIHAPLILAAVAENRTTKGRLVVFGDSDFATDAYQQNFFGDILINAIDWSTQQENLISLTPKNNTTRTFRPPNMITTVGTVLLSICIIPLLVVLAGVWAWYSRRRRG
jgi:ABC-type uncharacterized transport system involved in gliding motility auxiliary subunit